MSSNTPAGWYPNPENSAQQRYWDGSGWTEHTAPSSASGQQAQPHQGASGMPQGSTGMPQGSTGVGGEKPNWFARHKVLSGALAVFIIIMIAGAAGGSGGDDDTNNAGSDGDSSSSSTTEEEGETNNDQPTQKPKPKPKPEPEPEPEAIAVPAAKIVKEFEQNELAADQKYKGKTLKITGVVDKIDTEIFDDEKYVLRLGGGGQFVFLTVNCNDMSTDELSTIDKGDKVTVVGEFDDGGDLGVEIKDCKLA